MKSQISSFNWGVIIFAIIVIIIGFYNNINTKQKLEKNYSYTKGKVINSRLSSGLKSSVIEYYVENKRYIHTTNKGYKKGITLTIKYSIDDPYTALIIEN